MKLRVCFTLRSGKILYDVLRGPAPTSHNHRAGFHAVELAVTRVDNIHELRFTRRPFMLDRNCSGAKANASVPASPVQSAEANIGPADRRHGELTGNRLGDQRFHDMP